MSDTTSAKPVEATVSEVMKFFGMTPAKFTAEWKSMSDEDKKQLKQGIGNESLTY
jgi:hypothetical protein